MSNDPRECYACGQRSAYFDPVDRIWKCPCGWRDGKRNLQHLLAVGMLVTCSILWADSWAVPGNAAFTQELQARVCVDWPNDPHRVDVDVQSRIMLGDTEVRPWTSQAAWSNGKPQYGGY